MRKLKLLLAACALSVTAGVQAQSWTAPTIAGENPVTGSQYKVMNVGAGKYLDMGKSWFGWETTAILSDNGIDFTMTADGDNWKFIRTGTQGVFTSGNNIPGDAMHVDNTADTYAITQQPNGYYHIHDANVTATCWGYIEHNGVWGPVAHADASTIGAYGDWVFLSNLSAVDVYKARLNLYNKLNEAYSKGADTDAAATVYNNSNATIEELNAAYVSLDAAIVNLTINGGTGVDLTSFIENADFEAGNLTGWTSNSGGNVANNGNFSLHKGTWFVEKWTSSGNGGHLSNGSLTHAAVNFPAGVFCVKADAQNLEQGNNSVGGTGLFLYANNDKVEIGAAASYSVYTTLDADGPLTIKFDINDCSGNWVCYDNITVTYYAQASDLLAPAIEAAEALNGKIPAAAYAALQQVVSDNTLTSGTPEDYLAAANTINSAVTTYSELVAPYDTWKSIQAAATTYASAGNHTQITAAIEKVALYVETLTTVSDLNNANTMATALMTNYQTWDRVKGYADALANVSNNNAPANQTLKDAISAQATVVSNASTDDQAAIVTLINTTLPGATSALRTAMTTYVNDAQPTNDEFFDLTGLIVNPHFTEGTATSPTGWTASWPNNPTGGWGGAHELRIATHNFEAYHKAFELSQTIADLPKGTYKVTLQGFARHDGDDKDKTNLFCGVVNQPFMNITDEYSTTALTAGKPALGDTNGESSYTLNGQTVYQPNGMSGSYYFFQETNPATKKPFYTNEVQTLITTAGDLTIGFKCETWSDWVIWDNFHLYYYGSAIAVTIDEDAASSSYSEEIDNANVTLKRTFTADKWNTISLPFDLTDAETKAAFGNDAQVATFSETATGTNSEVEFNIAANASITANTPVLLKTSTTETTFTFNGKTIKAGEAKVAGTNFDFVGTYAASTTIAEGDYFIGNNQLWKSTGATTIKGTRAYLKAKSAEARIDKFIIDGSEASGIEGLEFAEKNNGKVYNLNGQRVEKAQKGLYIVNGKKVVVK